MKNTFVKVLSFVMALMMVVGTFSTLAVFAEDEHVHTKGEQVGEPTAPTCTTYGFTTYECAECGEYFHADAVDPDKDAHPADKVKEYAAIEADCLNNAKTAGKHCDACNEDIEGLVETKDSQTAHKIVGTYTEASCSEFGYYAYKCEKCGYTVDDILATKEVTVGETKFKLSFRADQKAELEKYAGKTVNENDKPKNEGHPADKNFEWVVDEAEDACHSGYAWKVCAFCGDEIKDTKKELLPTHQYTLDLNPNGADCSPYIANLMVCPDCKKPAPGTPNDGLKASGTQTEHSEWQGVTANENYLVLTTTDASGADPYLITGTNLPRFVKDGYAFLTETETSKWVLQYPDDSNGIGTFTHSELASYEGLAAGDKTYKPATHENPGHALVQCACGEIFYIVIPATEHTLSYGAIDYPESCTEATVQEITCTERLENGTQCPYKEVIVLKEATATEHDYEIDTSRAATCAQPGQIVKSCQNTFVNATGEHVCGEYGEDPDTAASAAGKGNYVVTYEDKLPHEYGEFYHVSGTCTVNTPDNFAIARDCKNCTYIDVKYGNEARTLLGIKNCAGDGVEITVPATCIRAAYKTILCTFCNSPLYETEIEDSDIDVNAHVYPTAQDFVYTFVTANDWDAIKAGDRVTIDFASTYTYKVGEEVKNGNWFVDWSKKPTCTTAGEAIVRCMNCGDKATKVVTAPKLGHVMGGAYIEVGEYTDATTGKKVEYQYAVEDNDSSSDSSKIEAKPATCQNVGYMDDGDICVMCLQGTMPTEIAKNPYNHEGIIVDEANLKIGLDLDGDGSVDTKSIPAEQVGGEPTTLTWWIATEGTAYTVDGVNFESVVLNFVDATCGSDAYWELNLKDYCGCVYTRQYAEETKLTGNNHNWVGMPYKEPTCFKAGNHVYVYCKDCGYRPVASTHDVSEWTSEDSPLLDIKGEVVETCACGDYYASIDVISSEITNIQNNAQSLNSEIIAPRTHKWVNVPATHACVYQDGQLAYKQCKYDDTCSAKLFGGKVYNCADATAAAEFEKVTKVEMLGKDKGFETKANPGECDIYAITPVIYVQKWNAADKKWEDTDTVLYAGTAANSKNYCQICDAADGENAKTHYNFYLVEEDDTTSYKMGTYTYAAWEDVLGYVDMLGNWVWSGVDDAGTKLMLGSDFTRSWYAVREYFLNGKLNGEVVVTDAAQKEALAKIFNDNYKKYENIDHDYKYTYIRMNDQNVLEDCTLDGYTITECKNCSAVYSSVPTYAMNTTHVWKANDTATLTAMIDGKVATEKFCEAEWYMVIGCSIAGCTGIKATFESAPVGHYADIYNTETGEYDRVVFDLSCDKIDDYMDMTCSGCDKAMKDLNKNNVLAEHKYTVLEEKATCEKDGFVIKTCSVCKNVVNTTVKKLSTDGKHTVPVDANKNKIYLEYVAPTVTTDGYAKYICANEGCGETIEEVLTATDLFNTVTVTEYETYAAGNTIKAIVSVSGSAIEFNTITIKVDLSKATALKLVDAELVATFGGASVDVAIVDGDIVIFALDSVEGDKLNATFDGGENVELLALTFTTNKMATANDLSIATTADHYIFWNAEYDEDEDDKTNPEVKTYLEDVAETKPATFDILTVGNVNGDKDGKIDASDIQAFLPALSAAALTGEYIAKYDLNNDGVVDFTDVAGLRAYVADPSSLYTYFEMIGEDVDAVLDAAVAPQIVVNYAAIENLIKKVEAAQEVIDGLDEDQKPTEAQTNALTEAQKALDEAKVTYVDDASDRNVLFTAAMNAIFAELNADGYKKLCAQYKVDNLTDLVAQIVKTATQELYANPDAADLFVRDIIFTADRVYIDIDVDGDIDIIEY